MWLSLVTAYGRRPPADESVFEETARRTDTTDRKPHPSEPTGRVEPSFGFLTKLSRVARVVLPGAGRDRVTVRWRLTVAAPAAPERPRDD